MYRRKLLKFRKSTRPVLAAPVKTTKGPIKGIWSFRQKVPIHFEKHNFTVKTVESRKELIQVLKLRYSVFHREFMGRKFPLGIDTDRYDHGGDLLIIIDNNTGHIVGTYRLISSAFATDFYSSGEFNLHNFIDAEGVKVELSRACVQKKYRKGIVVNLLWRGLAQYIQLVGAKYLFGCSSIQTTNISDLRDTYLYFNQTEAFSDQYEINPTLSYRIPDFQQWREEISQLDHPPISKKQVEIPPLLRSYLKAGAKLSPEPALDSTFKCIDFLTVLEVDKLSHLFDKRYVRS